MTKILNLLDDLSNVRSIGNGLYESGFWTNPDLGCAIVRIFSKNSAHSILGGEIKSERKEVYLGPKGPRHVKVLVFQDSESQHHRPRPARFRQNGCVATYE